MLLQAVGHIDRKLYHRTIRKQAELWDRIIDKLGGEWERAYSQSWSVEVSITWDDVVEDLQFGRDHH